MRRTRLAVEGLEPRDVPATFGIPWANGTALTVSFAPDGADVDGSAVIDAVDEAGYDAVAS